MSPALRKHGYPKPIDAPYDIIHHQTNGFQLK